MSAIEQPVQPKVDHTVKNLIVGFGFSAIPLVRELENSNEPFTIVSENSSVWTRLKQAGRLDFDLVSSYYSSFYSFDLVKDIGRDRYPTAEEFHAMHERYYERYKEQIVQDRVTKIENYDAYSIVHTKSGVTYRAENVVVATGFKRQIVSALESFDYDITGKVVVFNTYGDSVNLMISKLIPRQNKIVCLQDGFIALDKMFDMGGRSFTLDQLEFPNVGFMFKKFYADAISTGFGMFAYPAAKNPILRFLIFLTSLNFLSRVFAPNSFYSKYRLARRLKFERQPRMLFPNGMVYVKYWPIDKYAKEFEGDLGGNIKKGYMLNDIAFFIDQKLVDVWSKKGTTIDRQKKTITRNGETLEYDFIVDGGSETPLLPLIVDKTRGDAEYSYEYRSCYLGVVPRGLRNVFLLGYTRPMTGGLANITEMQGLFVHRMLTDGEFKSETFGSLEQRIEAYNLNYYMSNEPSKVDHLVMHGFYTGDVARVLGIGPQLKDVRSFKDLNKYFLFPNSAFKYRESGPYAVEGVDRLVEHVYREHDGFSVLQNYLGTIVLYRFLLFVTTLKLFFEGHIGWPLLVGLILAQLMFAKIVLFSSQNYYSRFKLLYLLLGIACVPVFGSAAIVPLLLFDVAFTFYKRRSGFRYFFNDLKHKRKYRPFFEKYMDVASRTLARPDAAE